MRDRFRTPGKAPGVGRHHRRIVANTYLRRENGVVAHDFGVIGNDIDGAIS